MASSHYAPQNTEHVLPAMEAMLRMLPPDADATAHAQVDGFAALLDRYFAESGAKIEWDKISPPPADRIRAYDSLPVPPAEAIKAALSKIAVLKLNGGLGTTMGCTGPKSVIEVRAGQTFLDLTIAQIQLLNSRYDARVPLILMNSFSTHADTEKIVKKYAGGDVEIVTFNQSRYPRVHAGSMQPVPESYAASDDAWYPPGHGDVYESLRASGILGRLLARGIEYVFISNVDNLGATVDVRIASLLVAHALPFIMEVTDKTRADVKGGTIISYEGRTKLLELAQVPKANVDEFKSIKKFAVFNTNSLWVSLRAVDDALAARTLAMDIIVNNKTTADGRPVVQLEQACGAAIQCFPAAIAVNVPRARFLPVKKTSDLLLVQSDLYELHDGTLSVAPARIGTAPAIKLSDREFAKVGAYAARFASVPSILELDHLTVMGNVRFGARVKLAGTVIIMAADGESIVIPDDDVLENKIVTPAGRVDY